MVLETTILALLPALLAVEGTPVAMIHPYRRTLERLDNGMLGPCARDHHTLQG